MSSFTQFMAESEKEGNHQVLLQELLFRSHAIRELARVVKILIEEDEKKEEKES